MILRAAHAVRTTPTPVDAREEPDLADHAAWAPARRAPVHAAIPARPRTGTHLLYELSERAGRRRKTA